MRSVYASEAEITLVRRYLISMVSVIRIAWNLILGLEEMIIIHDLLWWVCIIGPGSLGTRASTGSWDRVQAFR